MEITTLANGNLLLCYPVKPFGGPLTIVERTFLVLEDGRVREKIHEQWGGAYQRLARRGAPLVFKVGADYKKLLAREYRKLVHDDDPDVPQLRFFGRPSLMEDGKAVNVYLDSPSLAIAKTLGAGNVSDGIRQALSLTQKAAPED